MRGCERHNHIGFSSHNSSKGQTLLSSFCKGKQWGSDLLKPQVSGQSWDLNHQLSMSQTLYWSCRLACLWEGNLSLQIRVISRSYVNSLLVAGHRCFRRRDYKGTEPKDHHRDPAEWTGLHLDPVLLWDQHHDQQVHHWQRK